MTDEKRMSVTETEETSLRLSRRQFSKWLVGGIGAFMASAMGIPIVGTLASAAFGKHEVATIDLGNLKDYPVGTPTVAQFTITQTDGWQRSIASRSVWIIRHSENENDVTVFNGHCTHLGCAFNWDDSGDEANQFVCPCHNGIFAADGSVVSGPPPRPLDTLPVQINDGHVVINYEDYRSGIPEKTPV